MATLKYRRPPFSSRPFYVTVFLMTLLATYALFLGGPSVSTGAEPNILTPRAEDDVVCDDVHLARDQCAFVKAHCTQDEPGLMSYLTFYYCSLPRARPVAFTVLALWLGLLFSTIGIAASDFFSVNLSTIASVLGLPESLAGVTFLAFGNGSPDVFSTFAAMNSNSGSMAIGELIGAAGFITAVVAGSMALVREFKVSRKTFVRDIVFFIVSVSFTMLFLLDGKMHLWECGAMIGFYVFYVCFVVMWHWFSTRRRSMRAKQAASRSHYSVVSIQAGDEIEPYRDEADEETDGRVGQHSRSESVPDITVLESGTRNDNSSQDDDDEDQKRHVASEMTSSMRVNRPRGRRTTSTMGPIRPSLVGALEFRSVISSLAKSRNMRMAPLTRGHSECITTGLVRTNSDLGHSEPYTDNPSLIPEATPHGASRNRALSSGDTPRHLPNEAMENTPLLAVDQPPDTPNQEPELRRSPSPAAPKNDGLVSVAQRTIAVQGATRRRTSSVTSSTKDGHLAPPDVHSRPRSISPEPLAGRRQPTTPALSLQIPSPHLQPSHTSSPSLSPFPVLPESPSITGQPSPQRSHSHLPGALVETYDHIPGLDPPQSPQLIKWWPYNVLAPPHVLWRTLMPTLQGWRDKSIWDKIFSVFTLPSVFFLVITLPVVETETPDEEEENHEVQHTFASSSLGINAPAIAIEAGDSAEPETEWQEYRRRARSICSRSSSHSRHRPSAATTPNTAGPREQFPDYLTAGGATGPYGAQPLSEHGIGSEPTTEDDEPLSWNRWLIALQIFIGPLFTTFIVWAKYMNQPIKVLAEMVLYCLLGSLIVLALLLLSTTPDNKPKYHCLFCFLGFIISIAWISTIAEEVVGVLKAIGVILGMSEAILGLTIFAVGNSVGDLVADITVARLGFPVMALYAPSPPYIQISII